MAWDRIEPLNDTCGIDDFECGLESVDDWFTTKAREAHATRRVTVHTALAGANEIIGFFALRHIIVNLEGESKSTMKMAERDGQTHATGVLLAQMGVSKNHQGGGLGKRLVVEAMRAAVAAHNQAAFTLLVVDAATDSLVPYYQGIGFRQQDTQPRRLFMKMSAARNIIEGL